MYESKTYDASGVPGNSGLRSLLSDPLSWATKPPVIFKFASALLSLVIYFCISSASVDGRCLYNNHNGICRFGSLTLICFLACFVLLVLEITFSHISSVKVRRRIAIGDLIFSGITTVFYLLLFLFLSISWLNSPYPPFACTGLAYVRYQSGIDMSQFMTEEQLAQEQAQYYDEAGNYQQQATDYTMNPAQGMGGDYINYGNDLNLQ